MDKRYATTSPGRRRKSLLRFLTCGSVDDGKSTLIGRLLSDTRQIFEDQLAALESDSGSTAPPATTSISPCWSTGSRPSASRASPSTSPTASSRRRSGSSSSPTRRATSSTRATWRPAPRPPTSRSCWSMPGRACCAQTQAPFDHRLAARHPACDVAINKIDLVGFDQQVFDRIAADYSEFAKSLELQVDRADPDLGALRRQCHRTVPSRSAGIPARRCSSISKRSWLTTP